MIAFCMQAVLDGADLSECEGIKNLSYVQAKGALFISAK